MTRVVRSVSEDRRSFQGWAVVLLGGGVVGRRQLHCVNGHLEGKVLDVIRWGVQDPGGGNPDDAWSGSEDETLELAGEVAFKVHLGQDSHPHALVRPGGKVEGLVVHLIVDDPFRRVGGHIAA
jgi:hypothetical protein